ncbi:hypothetical protein ABRP83_13940 [Pectobacterium brasiliense]|uniref:hypothetical protein n=1 Tax=Pectobacterium brasiliense TaxID=180957 RepID=UPI0032EFE007
MSKKGIETTVASTFKLQLQQWCETENIDDLIFDMNGSDRDTNADNMFSVCSRFFLIEMKSKESNIKDEAAKSSVCILCSGLKNYPLIRNWHRECHYIMWGKENKLKSELETFYTIYEDSVCRPKILPHCKSVTEPTQRVILPGAGLALRTSNGEAGLIGTSFFPYLAWLLSNRTGSAPPLAPTENIPIALYGYSANRKVYGRLFNNYEELRIWGEQTALNKLPKKHPRTRP